MREKMTSEVVSEVDRLFECFKCGINPPQSATRARKYDKQKLEQARSKQEPSPDGILSTKFVGFEQKFQTDPQAGTEVIGSATHSANKLYVAKQISPIVFYGSPHGVPPKRPSSFLRLLREIRVDLAEHQKLALRRDIWATFPKQDEAIKFAKGHTDVHVFSYQDHYNGQRRFLVSSYKEFWRRYKDMDPKVRHHYEVIQEALPCHLYFDLEYNKRENTGRNGDEMVDLLISVVMEALLEKYSIQGDEEWIVELDSSTEEKFSRHVIVRVPQAAFKDNSHVGAFVAEICSQIVIARGKNVKFKKLFVAKSPNSSELCNQLFVDTAVYSRNRCFRLALSSKAGKSYVLLPTARFKCKDMCEADMFMASLICNVDADCKKLLVCKMDLDCVKTLRFDTEENIICGPPSLSFQDFALSTLTNDASRTYYIGKSPFPALQVFIESIASIGNVSGKIRSWYYFSEYGLMVYSMSRNRYCERIGREHKSNHVIYVVDLQRAVYYQKCHDPDCRGYRSPFRPIPPSLISTGNNGGSMYCGDESIADGCEKEVWWREALKYAENVENMHKAGELFSTMATEEDDEWWSEVERMASQTEQSYCH